jgi:putative transcriptional regulator
VAPLARTLRQLRQARGLTQAQLAQRAGVSQGLISLIEAGRRTDFTLRVAVRVAKVLGVPVERLAK